MREPSATSHSISATISILIVDDHAIVRRGVNALLGQAPDLRVVAEAATGEAGIALAGEHAPDVALVDLVMPGGLDGVATTRGIKQASPRTQVLVLTSYHTDEHIFPALRAGALSYLLKDVQPDDLVQAIRRAAQGEATLSRRVAERVMRELHGDASQPQNPFAGLTGREADVLRFIAAGRSNAEIAAELVLAEKTIKGYVSSVLSKLQVADRTQAAVMAWREGLRG